MRNRVWIVGICLAVIVGAVTGLLASRQRDRSADSADSGPSYGTPPFPHHAFEKITVAEMLKRARFPILVPVPPEGWHLIDVRDANPQVNREKDMQSGFQHFILYYDTDPNRKIEDASIMVFESQTGRTPEMEKAFVERLRRMKFNVTIESIGGHDVVFDAARAYFMDSGALYKVTGSLYRAQGSQSDEVMEFVSSMVRQIRVG